MPRPYRRTESTEYAVCNEWPGGFGWLAHPGESGQRVSHAVSTGDGVWLLDPLDAPGIDERIAALGEVAGVAVLSEYHARDADVVADRYGVPVTVPSWLRRVPNRVDAPLVRVEESIADFALRRLGPMGAWRECVAHRESDGTLYVPDGLSSHEKFTAGEERLGLPTLWRLFPPRDVFADISPERILFGHGEGVFEDADRALADTLDGARVRFPRALGNLPGEIRAMTGAFRG